jgi:hypothetical protein
MSDAAGGRHRLRPVTFADVDAVAGLLREVRFKARSRAGWRWLFEENPAHRRQDPPPPMGWVLERDGDLHGYLGNVHLDYLLDGAPVRAATCTSYYVRPGARSDSTRLMSAFFRQPRVEVFLTTTANALSEPIYRLFKAEVPQDPSFSEGLVWVADDRLAIRDTLTQAGMPRMLSESVATIGSPAAGLLRALTGFATPPDAEFQDAVIALAPHELDARFDQLCTRVAGAPGLRVRRDAATLRWYLSDPDAGAIPTIIAAADDEGLLGYAVAAPQRPPGTAAAHLRIIDFVVRPGAERAIPILLRRVLVHARELGIGVVYCVPCGASLWRELKLLRPYSHRHAYAAHFVRAAERRATAALTAPSVWHATGLDGDAPLCIELAQPAGAAATH